ncbi:L-ribulose-5-phosphate 4-epimerase AraD [Breznakiella homolactica]|uniref:L-ribulose-5-phosphate 4-epimerase n=1 Tax=Breznakiella homolactica TaxID=2798577 RepID=A0A7T8BD29_9SPIR|nr:L-ribulose-5-phosphate 4-epimerase AraD [Breznakiella homolactica]QQO10833.1 L-ribulose-5-phosphate 4-epimerase AraD [Breznakiella homolactica]
MDMYKTLREEAWEANMEIPRRKLAIYTWGNVSAFDPALGVFAIKPSGVPYDALTPESMVVVDLDGAVAAGKLNPSSDTETHRVLYREFVRLAGGAPVPVKGITHTHSPYAVAFAQARRPVPVYGTTHADHGAGEIPCTEYMDEESVKNDYELETGNLIAETFRKQGVNPFDIQMVLVAGHGPFTWGKDAAQSVYHAAVLEEVCKMAHITLTLNPEQKPLPDYIIRKHWERKHGDGAYYGQKN